MTCGNSGSLLQDCTNRWCQLPMRIVLEKDPCCHRKQAWNAPWGKHLARWREENIASQKITDAIMQPVAFQGARLKGREHAFHRLNLAAAPLTSPLDSNLCDMVIDYDMFWQRGILTYQRTQLDSSLAFVVYLVGPELCQLDTKALYNGKG